jgi:alpha-tubulin suppressor-like RCC1 family protein
LCINEEYLFGCGGNDKGQLGIPESKSSTFQRIPLDLKKDEKITSLACGWDHSLIATNRRVLVSGNNKYGQIGIKEDFVNRFTELSIDSKDIKISTSLRHSVLLINQEVYVMGDNKHRKCILNNVSNSDLTKVDLDLKLNEHLIDVAASHHHSFILTNQRVLIFGASKHGLNTSEYELASSLSLHAGWGHILIKTLSGWFVRGRNDHGQLGVGHNQNVSEFLQVDYKFDRVCMGSEHSLALLNDVAFAWGWNEHGNLGTGDTNDRFEPQEIAKGVYLVGCGYGNSFLILLNK